MGEDLFAEMCMRKNGVSAIEAFDISKDGCCEAKRPGHEKKNKKILEPATIGEESVAKKLTSMKTAKPNAQMYFSILIAMVGEMMFGFDQGKILQSRKNSVQNMVEYENECGPEVRKFPA